MPAQNYNWKRYWCPRESSYSLDGNGYLADPEESWVPNSSLATLGDIATTPCLCLLGEPGIGKSTAIETQKAEVDALVEAQGHVTLSIDLRTGDTEGRLIQKIFKDPIFSTWVGGSNYLHLYLDSLDECLLRVRSVADFLIEELSSVPVERLFIRITCRTAEWPQVLENGLTHLYGKGDIKIVELLPLRRKDVSSAAIANEIDASLFLQEIERVEAVPLAIKPVTLRFLINSFKSRPRDEGLPFRQAELYQKGCRLLCEETNESRQAAHEIGTLDATQKMLVAARIAALTVFSNRYAVYRSVDMGNIPPGTLSASDIRGVERVDGFEFEVSTIAIQEALETGLFTGRRSAELMGWGHQTYAEFLAAWYLCKKQAPVDQMLALISHPEEDSGQLVPQLHETAAWLASMVPEVFRAISKTDPAVLLRSDITTAGASDRAALVASLLASAPEGHHLANWRQWQRYHKLYHPQLDTQLRPVITDKKQEPTTRILAIEIADACKLTDMERELATIAMDVQDVLDVRVQAAVAIWRFGSLETRTLLRPLAFKEGGNDPNDELKGFALKALWPDLISAEELFPLLTRPNPSFFGSYCSFIEHDVVEHLAVADLPTALDWASTLSADYLSSGGQGRLASEILSLAWLNLDAPGILHAFAKASIHRLKSHEAVITNFSDTDGGLTIHEQTRRRHRLIEAIVKQVSDVERDTMGLVYGASPLILMEDIPWLLECLTNVLDTDAEHVYAKLVHRLFYPGDIDNFEGVFQASRLSSCLFDELSWLLEPVILGSERAERMREDFEQMEKWNQSRANRPLLSPPPDERIRMHLDSFEAGDLDAWWRLNIDMTLKPDSTYYDSELEFDLTSMPGWNSADDGTKSRLIAAANKYVILQDPHTVQWFGTNTLHRPAFAGYRALHLLRCEEPKSLYKLPLDVWTKWIPIVISYPVTNAGARYDMHREMVADAYRFAPVKVISTLTELISRKNAAGERVYVIDIAEHIWGPALATALLEHMTEGKLSTQNVAVVLDSLLSHKTQDVTDAFEQARSYAIGQVKELQHGGDQDLALAAARALFFHTDDAGWPTIRPIMETKRDFGRLFVQGVAYEDRRSGRGLDGLTEEELADLYLWMLQEYPIQERQFSAEMHTIGPEEAAADWRDVILRKLQYKGTVAANVAVSRISRERPDIPWLRFVLADTQAVTRRETWSPFQPELVLKLTANPGSRLVESEGQLLNLLRESLARLQERLRGEIPEVQFLWSETNGQFQPVNEEKLSNYIAAHLKRDITDRGIVLNREVVIRPTSRSPGERTDIHVDAMVKSPSGEVYDRVTVIIETKGCWNNHLTTAMETQLAGRYLKDNQCRHGIYLVGWFSSSKWDISDQRQQRCAQTSLAETSELLAKQAKQLSSNSIQIASVILDLSW